MRADELKELLSQMSLEEKIGQLVQLPSYFQNGGNITGPASDMGITQEDLQLAGSYLSIIGAEKIKALQDEYMAHHPHHIPLIFMAFKTGAEYSSTSVLEAPKSFFNFYNFNPHTVCIRL